MNELIQKDLNKDYFQIALKVTKICIICSILLCFVKMAGGFLAGDLAASLIVCIFIIRTAYKVFREAIEQMTDRSCDDTFLQDLRNCILSVKGVLGIDLLYVRAFGNKYYVDLEIKENGSMSLLDAHKVAEQVHDAIEKQYPIVKHIMIHVNPETEMKA